jgi:colanic acid biosynthesis glycosyl transferase WcaI
MSNRCITFINRFYWPEQPATAQLLTDLAEALACSGWSVQVITRLPPDSDCDDEVHNGVRILRVKGTAYGKSNLIGRALDFATFIRGAKRTFRQVLRSDETMVCMTDPPLLGVAGAGELQGRRCRLVHWIQDVFPEVAANVSGVPILNLLRSPRNRAWRQAAFCVTPGEDMQAFVRRQGVDAARVRVIPNWAPAGVGRVDSTEWRTQHGLLGKFVVMYSGNLGRVHDFSAVVPAAARLPANSNVQLVFVGDGARRLTLEREASSAGLKNITFLPAQPRHRLAEVLSAADVHLITLRSGCEQLVFPSKLYGIAAVGRAVLAVAPQSSELVRLIVENNFGYGFSPHEHEELASCIERLAGDSLSRVDLGENALKFGAQYSGPAAAAAAWQRLLAQEGNE